MLKLMALNGQLQGSEFNLHEGMTIGTDESCDVFIKKSSDFKGFVEVHCDASGGFSLVSKSDKPSIDLGGELFTKIEVLPGLIFTLGQVGFSIQEGAAAQKNSQTKNFDVQDHFTTNAEVHISLYPLAKPIRFDFVRGALLNTSMKINWHPYSIGAKSNLHHFIDEQINLEDDILAIERSTETDNPQTLIRPFISNFISINKQLISKPTIVKNGDLVEFSDTAFYIRIK